MAHRSRSLDRKSYLFFDTSSPINHHKSTTSRSMRCLPVVSLPPPHFADCSHPQPQLPSPRKYEIKLAFSNATASPLGPRPGNYPAKPPRPFHFPGSSWSISIVLVPSIAGTRPIIVPSLADLQMSVANDLRTGASSHLRARVLLNSVRATFRLVLIGPKIVPLTNGACRAARGAAWLGERWRRWRWK